MAENISRDLLSQALNILSAEDVPPNLVATLTMHLSQATLTNEPGTLSLLADGQPLAEFSPHGSLTFFVPPCSPAGAPRRLATFDRRARLLLLLRWAPDGTLVRFKVRGLDGRFLGVLRGTASHLGWGLSDSVCLLEGA